jgi:hypothetical protein
MPELTSGTSFWNSLPGLLPDGYWLEESGAADSPPRPTELEAYDVLRLKAFGAFLDLKLDGLTLIQSLVAVGLNGRKVNENILAGLALNESVSLAGVEPLHSSLFFHVSRTSLFSSYLCFSFASSRHKKRPQGTVALQPRNYVTKANTRATNATSSYHTVYAISSP